MENKFTPGPWHVKDNGLIFILPPDESGNFVVAGCGQTYSVSDWEKERSLANAALIAAAPEMYDLLERIYGVDPRSTICLELINEIPELLKKARGE